MSRVLSWLALPFVALAMVVVPLFGGHLCPEEVIPMLAGAASIPFLGPPTRALIARLRKRKPATVHCCNEDHRPAAALPVFDDQKPVFDASVLLPPTCSDGHLGCRGDDPFAQPARLCGCPNVHGLHGARVSCPPKEG